MDNLARLTFQDYLEADDRQLRRLKDLAENYRRFALDPQNAEPMFLVFLPAKQDYTIGQTLSDPRKMLKNAMDRLQTHLDVGDDFIPALRVEFGTGQIAHAYGCELYEQENDMPCAKGHSVRAAVDIPALEEPSADAGLMKRLEEYYAFFRQQAPAWVHMQLPDFQGPFNNAHLIRGNDILTDFYDEPELVSLLLEKVAKYQAKATERFRRICAADDGWFCDWSALWRGGIRISNCSLHMISTDFYRRYVLKWDDYLIQSAQSGRLHYCGTHDNGLFESFYSIPNMYGVDFDGAYHDVWELSPRTPGHVTLLQYTKKEQALRLLAGDWPRKRNLIFQLSASSVDEGKALLAGLRSSWRKAFQEEE